MAANPIQTAVLQMIDRRLDRRMLPAGTPEPLQRLSFPGFGIPMARDRQCALVEKLRKPTLVAGGVKPLVKTAGPQLRIFRLRLFHQPHCTVDIVFLPQAR